MSLAYREKFGNKILTRAEMKTWVNPTPPPKDADGKIITLTEQHHKDACDINNIIKRYAATGVIKHVTALEPKYLNCTGTDFKTLTDKMQGIGNQFLQIPSEVRAKFDNDPAKFLDFYNDKAKMAEHRKLGVMRSDWDYSTVDKITAKPTEPGSPTP